MLTAGAALVVMVGMAACGGDDDTSGTTGDADVTVKALDSLKFDKSAYTASAGQVTIDYVDEGSAAHTLLIEGVDGFRLAVTSQGDVDTGTADLEAGSYRLYCDVPGHTSMKATLTVT
jgi:plastocyanin